MNRRTAADNILKHTLEYLKQAGWTVCLNSFLHIDPLTDGMYPTDTAFSVQLGRDLSTKTKKENPAS